MDSQVFGFGAKAHRNPPTQSDNNDVVKAQDECGKGNKSTSNLSNEHRSKKHPFGVFAKKEKRVRINTHNCMKIESMHGSKVKREREKKKIVLKFNPLTDC